MTGNIVTTSATETDLESHIAEALRHALPWIDPKAVKHQLTFSFQLGHKPVEINGSQSSHRQGRLDILLEHQGKPFAILELKRPGHALTPEDVRQGLSYARVLHPRPPIVIVSNGDETRVYATHDGELLDHGISEAAALTAMFENAGKIAEGDIKDAIGTLMGPGSDVWIVAVRAASEETLAEMTGSWNDPHPVFTEGFHFSRKAAGALAKALRGLRRVIAIEGDPLIGKSHVLRELVESSRTDDQLAVLLVEASGTGATGIADEIARLLGSALGWRIGAEEARHWLETLGQSSRATLVVAIDGLGLEQDSLRHELEALSAKSAGDRLKLVIEADTSVIDRLWTGETRRKDTVFARRGDRIRVEHLDDAELGRAFKVLSDARVEFMPGARKAEEYRQPWLLRAMAASAIGAEEMTEGMTVVLPPFLSLDLISYTRDHFDQPELLGQASTLAAAVLDDYRSDDRTPELVLRSMHHFMLRKPALRRKANADDIKAMEYSGLIGTSLDSANRPLIVGRIPELIASELARLLADELSAAFVTGIDCEDSAARLLATCGSLPLGDIIGAQAIIDAAVQARGMPLNFVMALLDQAPKVEELKPGSRAVAYLPDIGRLELTTAEDGSTFAWSPEAQRGFKIESDDMSKTYSTLDAYMILSHVAGVPQMAISEDGLPSGRIDPELLRIVGSCPIPLRRVSEELERTGVHTHDASDGSSLVCASEGFIEPISFALFRFLDSVGAQADEWIDEVCAEGSAPLLNRLTMVLGILARREAQNESTGWAERALSQRILPALNLALSKLAGDPSAAEASETEEQEEQRQPG